MALSNLARPRRAGKRKRTPARLIVCDPRLGLILILQGCPQDLMAMLGIPCSTFIRVSQGSTFRCPFLPRGTVLSKTVYLANKLLTRPGVANFSSAQVASEVPSSLQIPIQVAVPGTCCDVHEWRPSGRTTWNEHNGDASGLSSCHCLAACQKDICPLPENALNPTTSKPEPQLQCSAA